MKLIITEHDHPLPNLQKDRVLQKCFDIYAFLIIGLESELELFEAWCLKALALGFEPVGGVAFCAGKVYKCRRLAFKLLHYHANESYVEKIKEFEAEWNSFCRSLPTDEI